ncbi:iron-siderophore ABC transporter substrate-binding protein [Corynebacterium sp. sy017]|uniref:ABC transporter substrate-binding protein n=1 Tax=unclassified Corynebacterium TaxID=2624378 RepID=UPI001184C776|nr:MULTISPECIES: ABC transporter substrate-binding protein [unclassified Corynebacterium]MBP3088809.1 iron-siderophore ABC transporter substrate-binding protein [Corynebacterium sp. sy017]QDZ42200.1 ABC transporter substrate-binding protein [Corynebacterium sp. sy039]TSD91152.1 iron-siderophore ABC transporter substrate-binding protein [Corynebacterium sp. SY003]
MKKPSTWYAQRGSKRALIAALSSCALLLGACSTNTAENSSKQQESTAAEAGENVASLGLGDVDTLLALGITPSVFAAWVEDSDSPNGLGPWAADDLPKDKKPEVLYGTGTGFTSEHLQKIAAAEPNTIVAVNAQVDEDTKAKLEAIAPVTYHDKQYKDWQVPWRSQVESVAQAVDKKAEGKELIAKTEQSLKGFRDKHPELAGKKVAIGLPYNGQLSLYTDADGRGALLEELGFEVPEEFNERAQDNFYFELSPENYDVLESLDYLFILSYDNNEDELKKNPVYANLKLVQENRVFFIEKQLGNAMSTPNPLSIPWSVEKLDALLAQNTTS